MLDPPVIIKKPKCFQGLLQYHRQVKPLSLAIHVTIWKNGSWATVITHVSWEIFSKLNFCNTEINGFS